MFCPSPSLSALIECVSCILPYVLNLVKPTDYSLYAGFIHLGTLAQPPLERPRPDLSAIVTRLA